MAVYRVVRHFVTEPLYICVRDLLEHVADVCPFTQTTELSRLHDLDSYAMQSTQKDPITAHLLHPAWKMKNLYELIVSFPYLVHVGDDDLYRFYIRANTYGVGFFSNLGHD